MYFVKVNDYLIYVTLEGNSMKQLKNDDTFDIIGFINPLNLDHIKAYKFYRKNRKWPEGFLPKNAEKHFPTCAWQWFVDQKIVDAYLESY